MFLKFRESREWIIGNPAKRTTQVKVPGHDTAILMPQEAANLLEACDQDILPGVIIGMFCGLRQAEIERLNWIAISLAQGIIGGEDRRHSFRRRISKSGFRSRIAQRLDAGLPRRAPSWTCLSLAAIYGGQAGYDVYAVINASAARDVLGKPKEHRPASASMTQSRIFLCA